MIDIVGQEYSQEIKEGVRILLQLNLFLVPMENSWNFVESFPK